MYIHTYTLRTTCVRAYAKIRNYFLTTLFKEEPEEDGEEEEDDKQQQQKQQKRAAAAVCVCVCACQRVCVCTSVHFVHFPNKYNEYKF